MSLRELFAENEGGEKVSLTLLIVPTPSLSHSRIHNTPHCMHGVEVSKGICRDAR